MKLFAENPLRNYIRDWDSSLRVEITVNRRSYPSGMKMPSKLELERVATLAVIDAINAVNPKEAK